MSIDGKLAEAESFARRRDEMVRQQLVSRGIRDDRVLDAMRVVPRERFVSDETAECAYEDRPLPILAGQTISQPYIVAFMVELLDLKADERVLEIGAGSGYAAAVMAEIGARVYALERLEALARVATENLSATGYEQVQIRHADGTEGWPEEAPFDAILVSAGAPDVPRALLRQLKIGGRMVVPVGTDPHAQTLRRIVRYTEETFDQEKIADVCFVPLIGREGWRFNHVRS